jgi:hypothetical protein
MSLHAQHWAIAVGAELGLSPPERHILGLLAFHADQKSGEAWPSVLTIARESGWTRRAVQSALGEIRGRNILTVKERPNSTTLYIFPPEALKPPLSTSGIKEDNKGHDALERSRKADAALGCTTCAPGCTGCAPGGAPDAPKPSFNLHRTTESVPIAGSGGGLDGRTHARGGSRKKASRQAAVRGQGDRITAEWKPSAKSIEFATSLGLDFPQVLGKFLDYYLSASGSKSISPDWDAKFRYWCRIDAKKRASETQFKMAVTPGAL